MVVWDKNGNTNYKAQVDYTNPTSLHLAESGDFYLFAGGYGFKFDSKANLIFTAEPPETQSDTIEGRAVVAGDQFGVATWIGNGTKTWFYAAQYSE